MHVLLVLALQYDPRNDLLYRGYLAATIIGVIGGIIGLILLYKQFVATKLAADAAKESADAAKKNADVLMASQKAQIVLKPHENPAKDIFDPEGQRMQIALQNIGHVPAYDLTYETWIEVLPFPFEDFTAAAEYYDMTEIKSLYPHHSPMIVNIPIKRNVDHPLSSRMQEMIRNGDLYVCVRVSVKYKEAFSSSRYASFGIYIMAKGLGFLPKYNDSN
jgi:hypothetical protein